MNGIKTIGILLAISLSMIALTTLNMSSVNAAANCDKATPIENPGGNFNGNTKKCGEFPEDDGPHEPVRKCGTPNEFKDNGGPAGATCKFRGNN